MRKCFVFCPSDPFGFNWIIYWCTKHFIDISRFLTCLIMFCQFWGSIVHTFKLPYNLSVYTLLLILQNLPTSNSRCQIFSKICVWGFVTLRHKTFEILFVYLFTWTKFLPFCCFIFFLYCAEILPSSTTSSQLATQSFTPKTDEFLGPVECLEKKLVFCSLIGWNNLL